MLQLAQLTYLSFGSAAKDYGLFLADEDPRKGVWLEAGRSLEYYLLRNGVSAVGRTYRTTEGEY